jgi:hypothetical protein
MLDGIAQGFLEGNMDSKAIIFVPAALAESIKDNVDDVGHFLACTGDGEVFFPLDLARVHERSFHASLVGPRKIMIFSALSG